MVFKEDLVKYPENGWALNGLQEALKKQDRQKEAALVKARFEKAWQYEDVTLKGSEVKPVAYSIDPYNISRKKMYAGMFGGKLCW